MWVMSKCGWVANYSYFSFFHRQREETSSVQPQQSLQKEASSKPNSPGSKYKLMSLCRLDLKYGAHTHWFRPPPSWMWAEPDEDRPDEELQGVSEKEYCYNKLPEGEKEKITTLFIMDWFSISHKAYHEMSQVPSLQNVPRNYLIQGCQASCNRLWQNKLKKTPGPWQGAAIPMNDLLESEIQRNISEWNKLGICDVWTPSQHLIWIKTSGL